MRSLLMGGQACILYGATEFSRDVDIAILASEENIRSLRMALGELAAEPIFFPRLEISHLERGHACHFRCHHRDCEGLRIDVMTRMRGCDAFPTLWERRTVLDLPEVGGVDVLSLRDLVQCKKTQRDKDWAMLRRLVEIDYVSGRSAATEADALWWLAELRGPRYLEDVARRFAACVHRVPSRPWLPEALRSGPESVESFLREEERIIREADRAYWRPLREELERMRSLRGATPPDTPSGPSGSPRGGS